MTDASAFSNDRSTAERGCLVVISGPSGVGKTTICDRVRDRVDVARVITVTTRPPRDRGADGGQEVDGVDYHFVSTDQFRAMVERGALLEHAEVYGNFYGTPRDQVEAGIARGRLLLLNIDVQGADQIRRAGIPELVTIFLAPPSLEELAARLGRRSTDTESVQRRRLEIARTELEQQAAYDHVVVNHRIEEAVDEIVRILEQTTSAFENS